MADERETVSDEEFFSEAFAKEEPKAEKPADPEPEKAPESPPRDEQGRFAPKAADEQPEAEKSAVAVPEPQEAPKEPEHRVPLAEYLSTRERAQALQRERDEFHRQFQAAQRQLAELQKPKEELPDVFADPAAFTQTLEQRLTRQFEERFLNASLGRAHKAHGQEFEAAYTALVQAQDPSIVARVRSAPDPGDALMEWHGREKAMREVGGDLSAYRQKLLDEALKDPEFRKRAMENWKADAGLSDPSRPTPVVNMPSLSRATAASRNEISEDEDEASFFEKNLRLRR